MAGQACLLDPALSKAAAREAARIAAQLLAQRAVVYPSAAPNAALSVLGDAVPVTAETAVTATADRQTVLVDTLELVRPRSIGVEHVAGWANKAV